MFHADDFVGGGADVGAVVQLNACSEGPIVDVVDIVELEREAERKYHPHHPKADEDGFVFASAVQPEEEMVDMLEASRQYQNNVEVVTTLRALMARTLSMGK